MIGRLTGETFVDGSSLLVDVGGVGYQVAVPAHTLVHINSGVTASFEISTIVKEDSITLYGFSTKDEKQLFVLLLSVSGIGPKTALQIVDRGVNEVVSAVQQADVEFFTSIPRLGKKNAQKIIIELTTKLGSGLELALGDSPLIRTEAGQALQALGYDQRSIQLALQHIKGEGLTTQEIVKQALRSINPS